MWRRETNTVPIANRNQYIRGDNYHMEKAIYHYGVAFDIASSLNLDDELFWVHYALARLFFGEGRLNDAHTHIENAKSHTTSGTYNLGRAMALQAEFWYSQGVFEKARSGASHAVDVFEKLGAAQDLERCRELLRRIDKQLNTSVVSDELNVDGESLKTPPLPRVLTFHYRVRKLNESSLPRFLQRDPCPIYQRCCPLTRPSLRRVLLCNHYPRTPPPPIRWFPEYHKRRNQVHECCSTVHDIF